MVWEGQGCNECRGTSYKGRTGIFEVLDMDAHIKTMVSTSVELGDLTAAASNEGMDTLRPVMILKILEGVTTYEGGF